MLTRGAVQVSAWLLGASFAMLLLTMALVLSPMTTEKAEANHGTMTLQFSCNIYKTETIDPMFPAGDNHLHQFWGGRIHEGDTTQDIIDRGNPSCEQPDGQATLNSYRTAWWAPAVRENGDREQVDRVSLYYVGDGTVNPFNNGFKDVIQNGDANEEVDFRCGDGQDKATIGEIIPCDAPQWRVRYINRPTSTQNHVTVRAAIHYVNDNGLNQPVEVSAGNTTWEPINSHAHADMWVANLGTYETIWLDPCGITAHVANQPGFCRPG
jgi:hypothetical protein